MTEPRSSGKRPLKIVPSCLSTSWRHIDVFIVIIIIKWRLVLLVGWHWQILVFDTGDR